DDTEQEPDETVLLALSRPRGCAALGAQMTATLTIVDDDGPATPPPPKYEVRGTLTGLAGTGLVLRDVANGTVATVDGASFTFGRSYDAGIHYDVRVDAQPINPAQACTVANATGTVPDHDVTDIAIACVTLADNPALDPAFGAGGKAIAP